MECVTFGEEANMAASSSTDVRPWPPSRPDPGDRGATRSRLFRADLREDRRSPGTRRPDHSTFGSKEALLLATLREVSEEFAEVMATVLEEAGDDDLRALLGIVDASLGRRLSDSHKIAVWYAFLAETNARADYQRICGERDQAWSRTVTNLCRQLIAAHGNCAWPDTEAVAQGLMGLIDQQWQGILFEGDDFDREAARRQCRAYLCSVFPWLAPRIEAAAPARARAPEPEAIADPALRLTLPAWVYHSEEFHELEREHLFLSAWQIVCHVSELPTTGDYVAFEFFGRRGFTVRGADGELRAFHNVCAHRAPRWFPANAAGARSS
jgi:AcrR family transcriptional regulator